MRWIGVSLICVSLLTGCGYDTVSDKFMKPYERGDFTLAAAEATKLAKEAGRKDQLIFLLEVGAIQRAAGQFEASNYALDKADALVSEFDQEADVKLSREAVAALTNLANVEYTGYGYDRIMMNTYKALNYMELGDLEKARVELRRAYDQQKAAVQRNAARIEEARELATQSNPGDPNSVDVNQSTSNPEFQQKFSESITSKLADFSSYADYVNPFAEYLQAIFLLTVSPDPADREMARTSLARVAGMIGLNDYVKADLELARALGPGESWPDVTYVLFETGLAPIREEVRLDLPLFLVTKRLPYAGVAFPTLKMKPNSMDALTITTSDGSYPLSVVSSLDSVISREFNNELPAVITRTIIAAATKAAISYAINESVKNQDAWVQLGTMIATGITSAALTQADLRTWNTLPKGFMIARFSTPKDRSFTLQLPYGVAGGPAATVGPMQLIEGKVNVIYVKSIDKGSNLIVRQFKLK